jgi:hypothetical protein
MAYRDQLYPWCIVRSAPNLPPTIIARFRRPVDAEAHLRALRHNTPGDRLSIIFEKPLDKAIAEATAAEATVVEATVEDGASEQAIESPQFQALE